MVSHALASINYEKIKLTVQFTSLLFNCQLGSKNLLGIAACRREVKESRTHVSFERLGSPMCLKQEAQP